MFKFKVKLLLLQHKFCILFGFALVLVKFSEKWDPLLLYISVNPQHSIYNICLLSGCCGN